MKADFLIIISINKKAACGYYQATNKQSNISLFSRTQETLIQ